MIRIHFGAAVLASILGAAASAMEPASGSISIRSLESLASLQVREDGLFDAICSDRTREVVSQIQLMAGAVCPAREVAQPQILNLQKLQDGRFSVLCQNMKRQVATAAEIASGSVCTQAMGEIVGQVSGRSFFKVLVSGTMTDVNVLNACDAAGYRVPCNDVPNGRFSDARCLDVGFRDGDNPMRTLSRAICDGRDPNSCSALDGVFQYMGEKWNGACGVVGGHWCESGSSTADKFALCVQ